MAQHGAIPGGSASTASVARSNIVAVSRTAHLLGLTVRRKTIQYHGAPRHHPLRAHARFSRSRYLGCTSPKRRQPPPPRASASSPS
eukprot:2539633-Prymnesium_polylepis.1